MGRRENKLGILGWLKLRGYTIEKLMYVAQRISGVGITIFLLAHILNVGLVYAITGELWEPPGIIGKTVLVILGIIVVFHTFNGVRLVLAEYGFTVGKPRRAVYPYEMTSLSGWQRLTVYLVLIVFIIILYFWIMVALNLLGW